MPTLGNLQFRHFRMCEFGKLTLYLSSGEQVLHGTRQEYEQVIVYVLNNPSEFDSASAGRPISQIAPPLFNVQETLEGIATYSESNVGRLFPSLRSTALPSLINVHLHEHFLREHPVLAVIDPTDGTHLNLFRQRATSFANLLAVCPPSPLAGTCPPGLPLCKPCKSGSVVRFRSLAKIPHNAYMLVTVPHPFTFLSYVHQKSDLEAGFVRDTRRDDWVVALTTDIMDKHTGGYQRIQKLKEYVMSDLGTVNVEVPLGIWETWEESDFEELQMMLGFKVDSEVLRVVGYGGTISERTAVAFAAKERVLSPTPENSRDMAESWNLAWAELWYFIRALQWRRKSELDLIGNFGL
jgi:hypothetical protein